MGGANSGGGGGKKEPGEGGKAKYFKRGKRVTPLSLSPGTSKGKKEFFEARSSVIKKGLFLNPENSGEVFSSNSQPKGGKTDLLPQR